MLEGNDHQENFSRHAEPDLFPEGVNGKGHRCVGVSLKTLGNVCSFDSLMTSCNDAAVTERNLKIVRFIGSTPSTAYCDVCKLAFRTRPEFVSDADKAKQQLQYDFDKHECRPQDNAVNDVLDDIG